MVAIEINAVLHCNLACVGCSHASPFSDEWFADPDTVERDLRNLATAAKVEEVRVVGGEPLLHPRLADLLKAVRGSRIGGRVHVVTNGTRLHLAPWDWLAHTDEVYVSRYPSASIRPAALAELEVRCRNLGTRLVVNDYHDFRLLRAATPHTAADTAAVFATCQMAHVWACHILQDGALHMCSPASPPAAVAPDERCALEPTGDLHERLDRFLRRAEPLAACRTCLGSVGESIPHAQANRSTWLSRSAGEIDRGQLALLASNPRAPADLWDREVLVRGRGYPLKGLSNRTWQRKAATAAAILRSRALQRPAARQSED